MARIPAVVAPYTSDVEAALAKMMPTTDVEPLAIFRTLARTPVVGGRVGALGASLLQSRHLSARDRELVILRTCARCGAEYEWGVHATLMAPAVGLSDVVIDATTESEPTLESRHDQTLVRLVDALHDEATIAPEQWDELAGTFSEEALVELAILVGFYHLISFVANAADLAPEPWAERFAASA